MPSDPLISILVNRQGYRDRYWRERDPILEDRLLWRAQTFASLVHLMPGQSILELGAGDGRFTTQLLKVSRGENPITAVTFGDATSSTLQSGIERIAANELPGSLEGREFDFVIAMDLLDRAGSAPLLRQVHELLKPGGQVLFYESNPWNPFLRLTRLVGRLFGARDPRNLIARPDLYELMSEIGFIRVFAVYNDFVYRPLTRRLAWLLRNASTLLENAPGVRRMAGSILVHAQRPPREVQKPVTSLCDHKSLFSALSVVIPCHNEEMNIEPLINRLRDLYGDYLHEIIPVDDNSRDGTRDVISKLAAGDSRIKPVFRTPPNGVDRAIADGYRAATGRYVLSMDCDFQHLLPDLRAVFDAAAEGYEVVVGSRFSRHSVLLNYPFTKIVANRAFHLLAQLVLLRRFRDLTNNLKLIRRDVLGGLQLTQPGFSVNAETGLQPLVMGCSVKEVPISWINRTADMGASSFKLVKVGGGYWQVLWQLWCKCLFNRGPYRQLPCSSRNRRTWREDGDASDLSPPRAAEVRP